MGGSRPAGIWSASLVRMCAANFMLSASCYMLVPLLCGRETYTGGHAMPCGMALAAFFAGMLLPGPFYARLVETCSRKRLFLRAALLLAMTVVLSLYAVPERLRLAVFPVQGILFGTAQMALGGTLVNDLLASDRRTAAGILYAACGRLAWPAGWMAGLLLPTRFPSHYGLAAAVGGCLLAWILIAPLKVPLKAPLNVPLLSLDRFWQTEAWPLFLAALPVSVSAGMWMAGLSALPSCALLLGGLVLGEVLRQALFRRTDDRLEMTAGLLLIAAGWALPTDGTVPPSLVGQLVFGAGTGISTARLLKCFMSLSGHCRRGTAQNTCLLSWFLGLPAGLLIASAGAVLSVCGLFSALLALLYYLLFVRRWYLRFRKYRAEHSGDGSYFVR